MVKRASIIVAVVLNVAVVSAADWAAVVRPVPKQIPRIESQQGDDTGVCSGVVINATAGYVLTAAHCVPPGDKTAYSLTVNRRHAEVVTVNRILDLAVLRFKVRGELAIALAPDTPPMGSEIAVAGFMLGSKEMQCQFGHVGAARSDDGALVVDGVALPGDSGGAIIDTAGRLVGMTNAYYRGTAIGLAVPVETLRDFVEDYLPK